MFVSDDDLAGMTDKVQGFNEIRAELGLAARPADHAAVDVLRRDVGRSRGGLGVLPTTSSSAAQHHYFEWNNPGFEGVKGYEEYLTRQSADVGHADASVASPPRDPAHRHAG